ncbi:MAG: hypothetical protein SH848_21985 [Saprospiraceae bacterium]|nr:hypothetical protein [Saprospiraceae bacterium]
MKTPSDDLFQLVQSLNKQEKRYFKLYASRHALNGENQYLRLFNAIEKQEVYDEATLRKKFPDEAFTRQLHVAKNYLYGIILASLRSFHESRAEDRFYTQLRNAQLLFDKGLYQQSEKALGKAKSTAADNERFLQLLEVYRWEHQIAHSRNDFGKLENYIAHGVQEEFDLLDKYRNFLEFQALNDRVFIPYWKKGAVRNETEKAALDQLFEQPQFSSADHARSFYARYFYHNARFSYHLFRGEPERSYEHVRELVQMFESRAVKGRGVRQYSSALINLYIVQQRLGHYSDIPDTLRKLREVPADSPEQQRRLFVRSFNLEVDFYLSTGLFSKGVAQIREREALFRKYEEEVNGQQRLGLYYNLAYLHFGAADYGQALDWVNLLLQDPALETRQDIHCFGRLLNLVVHYELRNDQLLEYIVQTTYRFLSKRERLFRVESVMLKLMRHYPGWLTPKARTEGFRQLIGELEDLRQNEFERKAFEYFDFISWMESKAAGSAFEAVVKLKK